MLNLLPHHRFHIPNSLGMVAALLLLVCSVLDFDNSQELSAAGPENIASVKTETELNDNGNDVTAVKASGLKLGLLLFRR